MSTNKLRNIVISASFTAEPLEESIRFWGKELEIPLSIKFAPYNQIFQQLLDSASIISNNRNGLNVILIRFEDWLWNENNQTSIQEAQAKKYIQEFVAALKTASERCPTPFLVCNCPASPSVTADEYRMEICEILTGFLSSQLETIPNIHFEETSVLKKMYSISAIYDPVGEELGRIPYTPDFFAALGTFIIRKLYALECAPFKVLVLDCDNTLWKGVCGEDGPLGVQIDYPYRELQDFVIKQFDSGMLICLCSKNNEDDVMEVFSRRMDMPLQRDHLVAWRINWKQKSENIKSLAAELQLGIDSFIFIDDNPIECAEVRANCPGILSLQLPVESWQIESFLNNVWAFDRMKITDEDRKRSRTYQENIKREQFRRHSLTFKDFLEGLELNIQSFKPGLNHIPRVAQLTQRTNQFNTTTIRRSEAELQNIIDAGSLDCLCFDVSDRFGKYGLVGLVFYCIQHVSLKVDSFILSCRVLGRGVEHHILGMLGKIASARDLEYIEVPFLPTAKNEPAVNFLLEVGSNYREETAQGYLFRFPAYYAKDIRHTGDTINIKPIKEDSKEASSNVVDLRSFREQSQFDKMIHIAYNYSDVNKIQEAIAASRRKPRPAMPNEFVAPRSSIEQSIARIWQDVLGLESVGIHDGFMELGGTSLASVLVISKLNQELKLNLSIVDFFEAPTIDSLSKKIQSDHQNMADEMILSSRTRGKSRRMGLRRN